MEMTPMVLTVTPSANDKDAGSDACSADAAASASAWSIMMRRTSTRMLAAVTVNVASSARGKSRRSLSRKATSSNSEISPSTAKAVVTTVR